jgi:anti-sigma factor RsiW
MNCPEITERLAAFLDGQLAPAEAEQVGEHLSKCTPCHQRCDAMMGQDFAPMSAEEREAGCASEGFWDTMDEVLDKELCAMAPAGAPRARARLGGVPMSVAMAYAAALLLAVTWGYQHMARADEAEATAKELQTQLEQERRLAAEPRSTPGLPAYRPVAYTPQRATF